MDILNEIRKLDLPAGQFIVVGGGSLAVRGIRETRDLDIVVLPEVFEMLVAQGWPLDAEYENKWSRKRIKRGLTEIYPDLFLEKQNRYLDIKELIAQADIIAGIPFQPLQHLRMCKLEATREKDIKDVELIDIRLVQ